LTGALLATPGRASLNAILSAVARAEGVSAASLYKGRARGRQIARARKLLFYFSATYIPTNLGAIGQRLGGFDFTSIAYGLQRCRQRARSDTKFRRKLERLRAEIISRSAS
jgi:chromosomal replication initiation ATPase DnaA